MAPAIQGSASRSSKFSRGNPGLFNAALGFWLLCSALLWPHSTLQMTNALVCGAVIVVASLAATRYPQTRYISSVAAVWLLLSGWALPMTTSTTFWNNLLISFAVFFVSLIGPESRSSFGTGSSQSATR